jgi:hypothetical protein
LSTFRVIRGAAAYVGLVARGIGKQVMLPAAVKALGFMTEEAGGAFK